MLEEIKDYKELIKKLKEKYKSEKNPMHYYGGRDNFINIDNIRIYFMFKTDKNYNLELDWYMISFGNVVLCPCIYRPQEVYDVLEKLIPVIEKYEVKSL